MGKHYYQITPEVKAAVDQARRQEQEAREAKEERIAAAKLERELKGK